VKLKDHIGGPSLRDPLLMSFGHDVRSFAVMPKKDNHGHIGR